ncbi:MAG: bifunctional anthranilate synthase component II/anthranilate phosphoribosyltransferase [Spirochaetes bacterium]|nr:bifunctional anthranilate synthase component II/anthranilate phosphoribosyltransferase [Spirochaetota bacterium]
MVLMLDNYDSFTYNLYQIFLKNDYPIKVVRSDKITLSEIEKINPQHIVLSPGPGTPKEAGICIDVVKQFKGKYPILGVCLGHQAILAAFDVPIVNADRIVHGKVEKIKHNNKGIFRNIDPETKVTRYHSLVGKAKDIPNCFEITATSDDGEVMAVEHKELPLIGVQFHPESIGTSNGEKMILNFLNYKRDNVPIKEYLNQSLQQKKLTYQQAYDIMDELTEGYLPDAQISSLLTSMQMRGIAAEELAGFAAVLRKKAASFPAPKAKEKRLDTCGTGGAANSKTFNVSTLVSIITAAGGAKVVKHGNRAVTSKSGSADLLEKLGINIEMTIEKSIQLYKTLGITFLYARKYHSAMRFAAPVRAALGFRTIFNIIGPLANPAYATHQIIGVFHPDYTKIVAEALGILGINKAMVVAGLDGLDEISLCSPTQITEINNGWLKTYLFHPEDIGLKTVNHSDLVGGDVNENRKIAVDILKGVTSGKLDLVCLNCAAAFYIYGFAKSLKDGYEAAHKVVASGKAQHLMKKFAELSQE